MHFLRETSGLLALLFCTLSLLADHAQAGKTVNLTAPSVFYDRKQGCAAFSGGVSVNDGEYQLCAERAYVFSDASNSVSQVVAMGNVAVTNGSKRAYGKKAAYYRDSKMVILYGDEKTPAIVRDEAQTADQAVVGEKIKYWIDRQQVEVLKALISVPMKGGANLMKDLR